jgi:hypothetical protein
MTVAAAFLTADCVLRIAADGGSSAAVASVSNAAVAAL